MKKYIISGLVVVVIGVFAVYEVVMSHSSASSVTVSNPADSGASVGSSSASANGVPPDGTSSEPAPAQTAAASAQYKDGTYTSPVENAYYGNLQITVTIASGQITDVTFPEYPNKPGHTTDVSNSTLPVLKSEAIAAQSANVDIVSGATQDSQAFQQALSAVLSQAQA